MSLNVAGAREGGERPWFRDRPILRLLKTGRRNAVVTFVQRSA